MLTTHPRRTLLAVLVFVLAAGFIGGPLGGKLSSSGGFVAPGADSQVATPGPRLVTATLRASADGEDVADAALGAFAGRRDVTVGGPAVADLQVTETVGADLGRAELLAFPILLALSLLFFRGRAALMPLAVGVTTVMGTFLRLHRHAHHRAAHRGSDPQRLRAHQGGVAHLHRGGGPPFRRADRDQRARPRRGRG